MGEAKVVRKRTTEHMLEILLNNVQASLSVYFQDADR